MRNRTPLKRLIEDREYFAGRINGVAKPPQTTQVGFTYIPIANLRFARQKTHFGEDWFETHDSLSQERLAMPAPLEFSRTLKYLRENPTPENILLYNELTQVRAPSRATWLDAFFEQRKDGLYILTRNKTREEKLDEDTLMEDKQISLESWIENPTNQGLPRKNVNKGDLYFWNPRNGSVAGFNAGGDDAYLSCGGVPTYRNSNLGVNAVRRE